MTRYWELDFDPKSDFDPLVFPVRVITHRRSLDNDHLLVDCDQHTAAFLRQQSGVTSLEPASDGPHVDDSGFTVITSGRGQSCRPA